MENENRYLKSLSHELSSQAKRVRDLIGDRHWLSDGVHHEALLAGLLDRHVGNRFTISKGFLVDIEAGPSGTISKEQDILVLDCRTDTPLFSQNELSISDYSLAVAAISVKATCRGDSLEGCLEGLASVQRRSGASANSADHIWRAGFFYDVDYGVEYQGKVLRKLGEWCQQNADNKAWPNCICINGEYLFKIIGTESGLRIVGWAYAELAASAFVANLLDHLRSVSGGAEPSLYKAIERVGSIEGHAVSLDIKLD